MNSILYEKEITVNAIDSAYEKGKKDGLDSIVEELERIKNKIMDLQTNLYSEDEEKYSEQIKGMTETINIINESISELKSESENNGKNNFN